MPPKTRSARRRPGGNGHRGQRLAPGHVADGVDAWHRGFLEPVGGHEAAGIGLHARGVEVQLRRGRVATDRPDQRVEGPVLHAVAGAQVQAIGPLLHRGGNGSASAC